MGFEKLEKAVLEKAKREADSIIRKAEQEAKSIIDDARRQEKAELDKARAGAEKLAEQIRNRELASSRLEAKKSLLQAKKAMLEKAFDEAKARSKTLPASERKKLLQSLLQKAQAELGPGRIYCNKKDTAYVPGAVEKDMLGGLIAESRDSTTMVDYSFETLLAGIKDRHVSEISAILQ